MRDAASEKDRTIKRNGRAYGAIAIGENRAYLRLLTSVDDTRRHRDTGNAELVIHVLSGYRRGVRLVSLIARRRAVGAYRRLQIR
jgi:hypothetical protein